MLPTSVPWSEYRTEVIRRLAGIPAGTGRRWRMGHNGKHYSVAVRRTIWGWWSAKVGIHYLTDAGDGRGAAIEFRTLGDALDAIYDEVRQRAVTLTHTQPDGALTASAPSREETTTMTTRTFTFEFVDFRDGGYPYRLPVDQIGSADQYPDAVAYTIRINGEPIAAHALYIPSEGRIAIAWGADSQWGDVAGDNDIEVAIDDWLNDGAAWDARR